MENPATTPGPSRSVGLVLLGSARAAGRTALARLLSRLGAAGVEDPPVVRVDAGRAPGELASERGEDDLDLGASGDPGADLAAAGRALAERFGCELLAVVDGAPDAGGGERLELLDRYALGATRELGAILGRIEDAERGRGSPKLAEGCFLVSTAVVERLAAAPDGALEKLRRGVRAQLGRGGPFDVGTPFGHRPRALGVPVVDLRVVRRLRDARIAPAVLDEKARARLIGTRGLREQFGPRAGREHWLDEVGVPEALGHGEVGEVRLRGWVAGEPTPRRVEVAVDGRIVATGSVRIRRPDILAARPELGAVDCGFELVAPIGPMAPGTAEISWAVDGGPPGGRLGEIRIDPVHRIAVDRILAPARRSPGDAQLLRVEGRVVASADGVEAACRLGERRTGAELGPRRRSTDPALPATTPFVVEDRVPGLGDTESLVLTLESADRSGASDRRDVEVELSTDPDAETAGVIERREIGPLDPVTGRVAVALAGVGFGFAPGERLALRADGRELVEATLAPRDPEGSGVVSWELCRELAGLGAGGHRFELVRLSAEGGESRLARWEAEVAPLPARGVEAAPRIERLEAAGDLHRVVVEGALEESERVESLALAVDGRVEQRLGGEWLSRDEIGSQPRSAARRRFRFDGSVALAEGRHELEIRVRRGGAEVPVWRDGVDVSAPGPERSAAGIACPELDRLLREDPAPVWSRLVLAGRVAGAPQGSRVRLELAGREVAERAVDADGGFRLEARPEGEEPVEGRVEVLVDGTSLVAPPPFRIAPRRLRPPDGAAGECGELLSRLLGDGVRVDAERASEVLRELVERSPGQAGRRVRAISERVAAARAADRRPARLVERPPEPPGRRLRVLLACWEIPSPTHGGGVAMLNLLRHLGERHDLTMVHSMAPGEEDLSDEVRPLLGEILPVRKEWRPEASGDEFGVPEGLSRNRSPRVRQVVEAELATGRYDLVNYEFNPMALHAAPPRVPAVGVLHEVHLLPALVGRPSSLDDPAAVAAWLEEALFALDFETRRAPAAFGELATLTRPEAEVLAPWLPGRRIFVTPFPIDTARLAPPPGHRRDAAAPTLLFVGNYIHPPNREAALRLARGIAPGLVERRPELRVVIAGPSPPDELRAAARPPGIEVAGFVPDLEGLLHGAFAVVAPIASGGGMRVKLLEAMAAGCPVISTPLGFNGIPVTDGRDALVAGTDAEFVAAAERLLDDPDGARAIAEAGRAMVERRFGIGVLGENREGIWRAVLDGDRGPA